VHIGYRDGARHLVDAIAKHGISSFLSSQLSTLEARLPEIDRLLTAKPAPTLPPFSEDEIRDFLRKESKDFCQVLVGDPKWRNGKFRSASENSC
jgi:hypothetical protein